MDLLPPNASPLKIYSQAKRLLKSTNRASEPDWYKSASEINLQWHLWIGAHSMVSAIYSRSLKQWWTGPELPPVSFATDDHGQPAGLDKGSRDALHEQVRKILAAKEFGAKPKSLGVVLHLADGVRIRDLAPDFAGDGDFENLNELLISAPEIALGDDSVDHSEGKWRILPLLGIQDGLRKTLAVQVSSKFEVIAEELRHYGEMRNLPVVVEARSAQVEAISGIAYLYPEIEAVGAGSSIALIHFEAMTILFAMGNRGEVQLVRPLMHRGTSHLSPSEIHEVLSQTAALLNIKDPFILFASVVGLEEGRLDALLEVYREQFPNARTRFIDATSSDLVAEIPGKRLEFAVSVAESAPWTEETPFQKEFRERWTRQNFYGLSKEEVARIPQRVDLQILKYSGFAQKLALAAILAFCGWTGMDFFTKMRSDAWKLSPTDAQEMEIKLAMLQKERREWQHWDRLLQKRSEGWLAMETLLELFPSEGGVILRDASYRTDSEQSTRSEQQDKLGLKRFWDIAGYANPEVATSLPTLGSRSRVAELLNTVAERNHSPYLSVNSQTRDLQVTLQQKQGTMPPTREFPAKVARHFRTAFELNISQSLSPADDLAFNIFKDEQ